MTKVFILAFCLPMFMLLGCKNNYGPKECEANNWGSIHFVNSTQTDYDIYLDLKLIGEIKPDGTLDKDKIEPGSHGWEVSIHNHIVSNPPDYGNVEVAKCGTAKVTIDR
jgi:hypothetical protein